MFTKSDEEPGYRDEGWSVRVEVSANWITLEQRDGTLVKIGKRKRPGHRKADAMLP